MKPRKVVYNTCYGGFSISSEAARLYRKYAEEAGIEVTAKILDKGLVGLSDTEPYDTLRNGYSVERHDPILVRVVEELGEKANGSFADLRIEEISGQYRIDEYDGMEQVMTRDDYDWI